MDEISRIVFEGDHGGGRFVNVLEISLELPRGSLKAQSGIYIASFSSSSPQAIPTNNKTSSRNGSRNTSPSLPAQASLSASSSSVIRGSKSKRGSLRFIMNDLRAECIVGLHPHERRDKQRVEVDVEVSDVGFKGWDMKMFGDRIYDVSFISSVVAAMTMIPHGGSDPSGAVGS